MAFPAEQYRTVEAGDYCLATIPDFNSLIAKSQENQTPIFALTEEQIKQSGVVLEQTIRQRDSFHDIFSKLANNVIHLTED